MSISLYYLITAAFPLPLHSFVDPERSTSSAKATPFCHDLRIKYHVRMYNRAGHGKANTRGTVIDPMYRRTDVLLYTLYLVPVRTGPAKACARRDG